MINREVKAWDKFWYRTALGEQIRKPVGRRWKLKIYELCRCVCWKEKYVCRDNLFNWKSTNCTCMQYKNNTPILVARNTIHWMTNTRLFRIYRGICTRCNNPRMECYKNYWGRWIKCLRNSFLDFYNDMHESYEEHCKEYGEQETTIDRIDVNWNYCKENCRWATNQEQGDNRRLNRKLDYNGKHYDTMSQLARELKVPITSLHKNIQQCNTIDQAVERTLRYKWKKFWKL